MTEDIQSAAASAAEPALVASLPEPVPVSAHSGDGQAQGDEHLLLKWGTLKGWNLGNNEAARAAAQRYDQAGQVAMGCMQQHDNPAQKQALCDMIDAINGPIQNDWTGEKLTKDQAKAYVMEYGK
jgi:hypothetical protein